MMNTVNKQPAPKKLIVLDGETKKILSELSRQRRMSGSRLLRELLRDEHRREIRRQAKKVEVLAA